MEQHAKSCRTCGSRLGKKNRSGYCRAHFAAALHADPVASEIKRERFRVSYAASPSRQAKAARLASYSHARLAWCPAGLVGLYRELTRNRDFRAAEAKAIIHREIARLASADLPRAQLRRAG